MDTFIYWRRISFFCRLCSHR